MTFLALAILFGESQDQRTASCRATLTALHAARETSAAGIRPLQKPLRAEDVGKVLAAAFAKQLAVTKAENERRRKVVADVTVAATQLRQSDFCKS
jgi:hypothetical protein